MVARESAAGRTGRETAAYFFTAAILVLIPGVAVATIRFPGGFDWVYMVISRLGNARHNPEGARWLTGSLLLAACLLWPVAGHLGRRAGSDGVRPRVSVTAFRIGLLGAALLAAEGLTGLDLSWLGRKGHEVVAMLTFLGLYGGVLGLCVHRIGHAAGPAWPPLLVVFPLLAVGASQVRLYLEQRDLGWVNVGWRELGVPFWLSFAFWQWLAVAFLLAGIGYLVVARDPAAESDRDAAAADIGPDAAADAGPRRVEPPPDPLSPGWESATRSAPATPRASGAPD